MSKVGQPNKVTDPSPNVEPMRPTSSYRAAGEDVSVRVNDWMKAVRAPTAYRIGGPSVHLNGTRLAKMGIIALLVLTVIVLLIPATDYDSRISKRLSLHPKFNSTYPLSSPQKTSDGTRFRIGIISDLDTTNKVGEGKKMKWTSYFRKGYLTLSKIHDKVSVEWDTEEITLESGMSLSGRGMELSELQVFNGKLYTCDDRTGLILEITPDHRLLPWVILQDGNGQVVKGNVTESTIKVETLATGCVIDEY